jgi:hypothetical protein
MGFGPFTFVALACLAWSFGSPRAFAGREIKQNPPGAPAASARLDLPAHPARLGVPEPLVQASAYFRFTEGLRALAAKVPPTSADQAPPMIALDPETLELGEQLAKLDPRVEPEQLTLLKQALQLAGDQGMADPKAGAGLKNLQAYLAAAVRAARVLERDRQPKTLAAGLQQLQVTGLPEVKAGESPVTQRSDFFTSTAEYVVQGMQASPKSEDASSPFQTYTQPMVGPESDYASQASQGAFVTSPPLRYSDTGPR